MKAAVFYGKDQPLRVEERPDPKPGPGEVRVEIAACGICHTDIGYIDHGVPTFKKPPLILGHEASGRISQLGEGVEGFRPGDRVLMGNVFACGTCSNCLLGRSNVCENMRMLGNHLDGAFAEYAVAPARDVFHLPDEVPLVEGSIIADAMSTPYHAVVNRAQIRAGEKVAVYGTGGVGMNCVQIAAAVGGSVIAVDVVAEKLDLAMRLGAADVVDAKAEGSPAKAIRKMSMGGVDVAIECIGDPSTIKMAYDSIKPGGRLVIVGYPAAQTDLNLARLMFREQQIIGSLGCRSVDFPHVIDLVKMGKIQVEPIVSGQVSLEKINEGL
ncbi:MAG: alcohol dehydrogenase catalytic domain-containing protein, partial [Deltaproteobacteria bacterium]|nr:alcohol dehydrogenase catalytic domain-containing protein [Deltaproteobacteria bacterium]